MCRHFLIGTYRFDRQSYSMTFASLPCWLLVQCTGDDKSCRSREHRRIGREIPARCLLSPRNIVALLTKPWLSSFVRPDSVYLSRNICVAKTEGPTSRRLRTRQDDDSNRVAVCSSARRIERANSGSSRATLSSALGGSNWSTSFLRAFLINNHHVRQAGT